MTVTKSSIGLRRYRVAIQSALDAWVSADFVEATHHCQQVERNMSLRSLVRQGDFYS